MSDWCVGGGSLFVDCWGRMGCDCDVHHEHLSIVSPPSCFIHNLQILQLQKLNSRGSSLVSFLNLFHQDQQGGEDSSEHSSPPQDKVPPSKSSPEVDCDEVANFVNMPKYLGAQPTNYYYTPSNKQTREKLEKYKSKKTLSSQESQEAFDTSLQSKKSILSRRLSGSSYHGPQPKMKDGSSIKPARKMSQSSRRESCQSDDAIPSFSSEGGSNTPDGKIKRNISFTSINIREHERIAGDNPCVTSGVPLSIGWGYVEHPAIDFDHYEANKGPSRDKIEMMVPAAVRKQILRDEFKVSVKDINEAMKNVNIAKRQRRNTVASEHMEGWGEVMQSAKRKFGRALKGTTTKKEEQKLWENAQKNAMK